MAPVPEAKALKQLLRIAPRGDRVDRPETGDELELLHRVELAVNDGIVREVGERRLGPARLGDDVDAADLDAARHPAR